jgi:hypothetical protein
MDWEEDGTMRIFHGRISREEAETRLMEAARDARGGPVGEGLYLVRENPRNNYSLILSFTELKPTRRQWTKPAVEDEEQQHKEGGASKTELAVTHWQVNVNRYSKVEGFFLINKPNRVCLTLNDLLVDVASVQARTPALRPEVLHTRAIGRVALGVRVRSCVCWRLTRCCNKGRSCGECVVGRVDAVAHGGLQPGFSPLRSA